MDHAPAEEPDLERTAALARAAVTGDVAKLGCLYERVAPSLYAWASLRAPRGVDPGDILGDVWLRAVEGLRSHDIEHHEFRSWIFGIAKHVLLQELRTRGRGGRQSPTTDSRSSNEPPASVTSVSRRLASDEALHAFLAKAKALDPVDHELLVFCAIEGFTCVEAATRLGINVETATKRWQRLRAQLRETAWVRDLLIDHD